MSFFANKNDVELAKRAMLAEPDLYGNEIVHEQAASVVDLTSPTAATFAIDAGIVTADDVFNSTFSNLYFIDDNAALAFVPIDDSAQAGNTVTFDSTAALLVSDESTTPSLTDTNSYQIRILQASTTSDRGLFMGDTSEVSFDYTINEAILKVGVPKKTRARGVVEVEAALSFKLAQPTDGGLLEAGFRGATQGSQTNQTQLHYGFEPQEAKQYLIQGISQDKAGRVFFTEFFVCELSITEYGLGGDEFKHMGVTANLLADSFRPDNYDAFRSISLD